MTGLYHGDSVLCQVRDVTGLYHGDSVLCQVRDVTGLYHGDSVLCQVRDEVKKAGDNTNRTGVHDRL